MAEFTKSHPVSNGKLLAAWWWIDRWQKSTAFKDLTLEEQGAYRNLLDELWLRDGVLPVDERILARLCGDVLAWPRVRDNVLQHFRRSPAGWVNDTQLEIQHQSRRRADKQRNYRERLKIPREQASIAGNGTGNGHGNAAGNGHGNKPGSPSPSPSPSLDLDLSNDPDQGESSTPPINREPKATEVAAPPLGQGFDQFWAAYPRKIGKAAAEKVWKRLHPGQRLTELMCEAVERQKSWPQWTKDGGQFIPHPATWLNQGRWDDEATTPTATRISDRTRGNQAAAAAFVARLRGAS